MNFNAAAGTGLTISGSISGNYAVSVNGSGTLVLAGANTYSGITAITGGTLQLNNAAAVQNSTVMLADAGGLAFGTGVGTFNLGGLKGQGNGSFTLADTAGNAVGISVGGNNASTTYSAALSGPGSSFTKVGSGRTMLSGSGIQLLGQRDGQCRHAAGVGRHHSFRYGRRQRLLPGRHGGQHHQHRRGAMLQMNVDNNTGWTYDTNDREGMGTGAGRRSPATASSKRSATPPCPLPAAGFQWEHDLCHEGGTIDVENG